MGDEYINVAVIDAGAVHLDTNEVFWVGIEIHNHVLFDAEVVFKHFFNNRSVTEVNRVVDVQPDVDGRITWEEDTTEYAWGVWVSGVRTMDQKAVVAL